MPPCADQPHFLLRVAPLRRISSVSVSLLLLCFALTAAATPARGGESPPLSFGCGSPPPFTSDGGTGYYDRLVPLLFARLGLEARVVHMPSQRAWNEALSGDLDGDLARVANAAATPGLVMVPEPVLAARRFVAFAGPGVRAETISWNALSGYHVGYVRGWKIFEDRAQGRSLSVVETLEQLFVLLGKGRIELALCGDADGRLMAARQGLSDVRVLTPPLCSPPLYLFLNARHAALADPLARELRKMRADGSLEGLMRRAEAEAVAP